VIAEGVETAAQAAFLRTEKCEELQGYFYAKPMPAGDLEAYLRSNRAQVFGSVVNKLAG
jgi:EAL domain-containing protein (putative c-di-GMP-specific phosphodiesterase class I)